MIETGIHFGLDEDEYHADPALGSTDLRRLHTGGPDYWWSSHLNKARPADEPTPSQTFGRALHKLVLEGEEAFHALYERDADGDDLLRSDADLAEWLADRGVNKMPRSKADKAALALQMDPGVRILDMLRLRALEAGKTVLKGEDYDRIVVAGALITRNPELARAFSGGMPEVSVFWEEDGIRFKARWDYLKPRGIGDLKSIRNSRGLPFPDACRRAISEHRYDLQAEHYLHARSMLPSLVAEGRVFGEHDPAWLGRVAEANEFGFAWVFHQSGGAPITWATAISPGNPILEIARTGIGRAINTYRDFMTRFGPEEMWVLVEPVTELDLSEMPAWHAR